jgi:hypothetical protein
MVDIRIKSKGVKVSVQVAVQIDHTPYERSVNAAMADGLVRFLHSSIDPKRWAAAIASTRGEPVDLD